MALTTRVCRSWTRSRTYGPAGGAAGADVAHLAADAQARQGCNVMSQDIEDSLYSRPGDEFSFRRKSNP